MAESYTLHASSRDLTGKRVNRLRSAGQVPAVLYGHGVSPQNLSLTRGELEKVYRKAGGSSIVTVKLPDGQTNALIHDIQRQPTTGHYLHVDLYQVRMDEKIKATVPLEFEGTPPAVRELDGVLLTNLTEVEVECLPADLPQHLTVSIDSLASFDDAITVADLTVPAAVTVLNEPETNVASVAPPRTQEELDELEEEVEEPAEPEVEGEEPAEGEEGETAEGEEGGDQAADSESDQQPKKDEN